jgi:general secretion pathway protein L
MIGRFFTWWRSTLAEMLPQSWTRSRSGYASVLAIDITPSKIVFRHRRGEESNELGSIERIAGRGGQETQTGGRVAQRESVNALVHGLRPEKTRCVVQVDDSLQLKKTVRLPLAAEENLRQVLAFEMERHTPFHADGVYFDYRPKARDVKQRTLDVDLTVVQKPVVDEALGLIGDWEPRFSPDAGPDADRGLTFLPRDFRVRTTKGLNRALIVLNLVALASAALIPIYQQERYIHALQQRADRARAAAMASVELQDRIDALEQRRALFEQAKSRPSVVELMEELARIVPDGTWLHRLDFKNGELQFQGLSDAASALIGVVESSPMFREARFGSPITRDARSGKERFHISAKLEPARAETVTTTPSEGKRS